MRLEIWQAIGVVCGAILAAAGVVFLAARGLLGMWRTAKRLTDLLDQLQTLNDRLEAHLNWHGHPAGKPASPVRPKPNGPPARRPR